MTPDMIKSYIESEINKMQSKKSGIDTSYDYQLGKVNGMIEAAWNIGALYKTEVDEIREEIMKKYF